MNTFCIMKYIDEGEILLYVLSHTFSIVHVRSEYTSAIEKIQLHGNSRQGARRVLYYLLLSQDMTTATLCQNLWQALLLLSRNHIGVPSKK